MNLPSPPKLTAELLRAYAEAALSNAEELLAEASLLFDHGHLARAYFLAVSSIEEAGKALQSFDSQNRNLADPAICSRLRTSSENHNSKINYALGAWAANDTDPSTALQKAVDLIINLQRGREPSMYTDFNADLDGVQLPREVVREIAAKDCIRLAGGCFAHARDHLSAGKPREYTPADDRVFAIKPKKFRDMLSSEDFWWYSISEMEGGKKAINEIIVEYEREYFRAGKLFRSPERSGE